MGHLKDIANQPKPQTFPGATYQIQGQVPASQCSEAQIEGDSASTQGAPFQVLNDFGKFVGWFLIGKKCTIITNPGGNTGTFNIVGNTNNTLSLTPDPGTGTPTAYYVHNGGSLILTRDIQSFAQFLSAAGSAFTIKGGKLYTSAPSNTLQNACSILFDPLT